MTSSKLARRFRRNKGTVIFAALTLGSFALNQGAFRSNLAAMTRAQEATQANIAKEMLLQVSQQQAQAQAQIAAERYGSGCVLVVAKHAPNTYVSLGEGEPVIDRERNAPLPAGTIVCDAHGNTGKIVKDASGAPVVGEMAFTGDRSVIDQRTAQASQIRYVLPTSN